MIIEVIFKPNINLFELFQVFFPYTQNYLQYQAFSFSFLLYLAFVLQDLVQSESAFFKNYKSLLIWRLVKLLKLLDDSQKDSIIWQISHENFKNCLT